MNQELEWSQIPVIKLTDSDKHGAKMMLAGTPMSDENKSVRGFLYYNIVEGDFIVSSKYEDFLKLLNTYLKTNWANVQDWDKEVENKSDEELEWDPHLMAYKGLKIGYKKLGKIAQ